MIHLTSTLHQKLRVIKWLIPLALVLLVVVYEIAVSRWIYDKFGFTHHLTVEILLFGTVGPLLVFLVLELLDRWIVEKETAELQANLLVQAKEKALEMSQMSDDTIQVLFAAGLLITSFKSDPSESSLVTPTQIEVTEQALHEAIQRLRTHLDSSILSIED